MLEQLLLYSCALWGGRQMEENKIPLSLLLIEDSEDDAILLLRGLRRNGFDRL